MKNFIAPAVLSFLLALAPWAQAQEMTEALARAWLAEMQQATSAQDTTALAELLAEDAQIFVTVTAAGRQESFHDDKRSYLETVRAGWQSATGYAYRSENEVIRIVGKQAIITADTVETMIHSGLRLSTRAQGTTTLELRDGKPLAIRVEAKGEMQTAAQ